MQDSPGGLFRPGNSRNGESRRPFCMTYARLGMEDRAARPAGTRALEGLASGPGLPDTLQRRDAFDALHVRSSAIGAVKG